MLQRITILTLISIVVFIGCATQQTLMEELPTSTIQAEESIDMRGKQITTYILYHAVQRLQQMNEGEVLEIVTDNFEGIESDIRAWSRMTGHTVLEVEKEATYERYYIEKALPITQSKQVAFVISTSWLEELLSPLAFALGAALEAMEVHIYFQGPGVRVLKKGFQEKLSGWGRPFSGFARKGMVQTGHIPPQEKLQQLKELGAHFYICGPSMQVFKVNKEELIFDDLIVAEYLTFMEIMMNADIHIYL